MSLTGERALAVAMLTRADVRRNHATLPKSDEDLVRFLTGATDMAAIECFVTISKFLRLMDALLGGKQTGESFVEKFSVGWLSVDRDSCGRGSEGIFEQLDHLYEDIQLFCGSAEHRAEEDLLFGAPRLQELVMRAYESILREWQEEVGDRARTPRDTSAGK